MLDMRQTSFFHWLLWFSSFLYIFYLAFKLILFVLNTGFLYRTIEVTSIHVLNFLYWRPLNWCCGLSVTSHIFKFSRINGHFKFQMKQLGWDLDFTHTIKQKQHQGLSTARKWRASVQQKEKEYFEDNVVLIGQLQKKKTKMPFNPMYARYTQTNQ